MSQPIPAEVVVDGRMLAEPRLSPDGTRLAFATRVDDGATERAAILCVELLQAPDGTLQPGTEFEFVGEIPPIGVHPSGGGSWCWLADSTGIAVATKNGVELRFLDGARQPVEAYERGGLSQPAISADGTLLAVVEARTDHDALLVVDLVTPNSMPNSTPNPTPNPMPIEVAIAPFLIDPCFDGSTLAWHEWGPPAMPWDHSTVVVAALERTDGHLTVTVTGRHDGGGVLRGQPRPHHERVAWIEDSTGFAVVHVDGQPLVDERFEHATPTWGPGQRSFAWSPDGRSIAFVRNEEGFARLCVAEVGGAGTSEPPRVRELAKAWHIGLTWARTAGGENRIAAIRSGGKTVPQLVVYRVGDAGESEPVERSVIIRSTDAWDGFDLPEPEVVHWTAPSGAAMHGRLYRPAGAVGALPLVVSVHGGPTDQSTVTFDGRFHFLLSRGWSVLTVDHRGSTGWGRAHQQAMNGLWGIADVDDCAGAVEHAVAAGWADPTRVVAMGGSAGGFTVLSLLARRGELFAGGVAVYPVTDLLDLDERTHRFEKHYSAVLVGPRPANEVAYVERSPISFASKITVPLLLLHGSSDEVVPVEQSIRLRDHVAARRDASATHVELHVYDGEGHGWRQRSTRLDELQRLHRFLGRITP